MKKEFLKNCSSLGIVNSSKILLAVSGGIDSMALLYFFHDTDFTIQVAHCNFDLRAEDSDNDAIFVRQVCKDLNIPFHFKKFRTKQFADKNKISIQMAARDLRYEWFEYIRLSAKLDYIATAHHRDDQVETVLLNLIRGTGINGLKGIQAKKNILIRPLLLFDKASIEEWMKKNKFLFREDESNHSLVYMRNKIRHQVIPVFKEINPSVSKTFQENVDRISSSEVNLSFFYEQQRHKIICSKGGVLHIKLNELKKYPSPISLLFYFISDYGFSDWNAIIYLMRALSGKVIYSKTHELLKHRNVLVLREKIRRLEQEYFIDRDTKYILEPQEISFECKKNDNFSIPLSKNQAALDFNNLHFPLTIRTWRKGDCFIPLGMRGVKKLSDFFIDEKMSLFEKENVLLLCSENKIVWIMGYQIDERFKLVQNTQKVYLVTLF